MLFAFGIAVVVHALLIAFAGTILGFAILKNPDLLTQIAQSPERIIELTAQSVDSATVSPKIIQEQEKQEPAIFIEVDPSQATDTAPIKPKYYAAQNTIASNPDTRLDTDQPKIDGSQNKVIRSFSAPRQPTPLTPVQAQQATVENHPKKVSPKREPLTEETDKKPDQKPDTKDPGEKIKQTPGEMELRRKSGMSQPENEEGPEQRQRPASLAQAKAMLNDSKPPGEKMQQDGGVRRLSTVSNLSAGASPLGQYDAKVIDAIKGAWLSILDERPTMAEQGEVVVFFRLHSDGRVTDLQIRRTTASELHASFCVLAIDRPAPFDPWPPAVKYQLGRPYRDITFTFFYQ